MVWKSDTRRRRTSRRRPQTRSTTKARHSQTQQWITLLKHSHDIAPDVSNILTQLECVQQTQQALENKRSNIRRQKQLGYIEECFQAQIRKIHSEHEACQRDKTIRPYIRAYENETESRASKSQIFKECMQELDDVAPQVTITNDESCPHCHDVMLYNAQQAIMICRQCGTSSNHIDVTSASTQYGDEVEFSTFLYKRRTHFNALIQNCQAKGSTSAPQYILTKIMEQLYRERIFDLDVISKEKVKRVIRDLKLDNKYYSHCTQIACTLSGKPPPRMTPEQEQRLNIMFATIQAPFERHCPADRKNFFSYSFCSYKCCELLGYREFLSCFPLLKGKKKLDKQDEMWKKICLDLDWEFVRSKCVQ